MGRLSHLQVTAYAMRLERHGDTPTSSTAVVEGVGVGEAVAAAASPAVVAMAAAVAAAAAGVILAEAAAMAAAAEGYSLGHQVGTLVT